MNRHFYILAFLIAVRLLVLPVVAADPTRTIGVTNDQSQILANLKPGHPRLLATTDDWSKLRARRASDTRLALLLTKIESDARAALRESPLTYKKEGRRLLEVSREACRRIELWAFCYQLTGDKVFRVRAQKEMLVLAAFPDWNPSHFLDTAEMTTAMAIGYDWLYDALEPKPRDTICRAIVEKGIQPATGPARGKMSWQQWENNWNQVCFGGLTLGALAVADQAPADAAELLEWARKDIVHGLKVYAPDGVYPEGPNYWNYGTTYQVLMIAALESALGDDWGLPATPGFHASAVAQMQQTGPTGQPFNFSDGSPEKQFKPALYWFARRWQQPELIFFQHELLDEILRPPGSKRIFPRSLPLIALWSDDLTKTVASPTLPLAWFGDGPSPIGVFRSSWTDPNALYLAFKGGSAHVNHAHMDAGSFILEADGVRWACDLGAQEYYSVESHGWRLFGLEQGADRWRVFRLNNFSHNTLTIDGALHRVAGDARIVEFTTNSAAVNLSAIFAGQATNVVRHFQLGENRSIFVRDELAGLKPGSRIRWQMVTHAKVKADNQSAVLRQEGKVMQARLLLPAGAKFEVVPADPPHDGVNHPNPNTRILVMDAVVPSSGRLEIEVLLQPGDNPPVVGTPVTKDELIEQIPGAFAFAAVQYGGMLERIKDDKNRCPRTFAGGQVKLVEPKDWTSGFFPGSLWLLYEYTGDEKWKVAADDYTRRLESLRHFGGTHDLGFMLNCSYGNGLRLANPDGYREVLLDGAAALSRRFDPQVGLIRSWDFGAWKYPVIIDNMMNLEFLTWAAKATGDARFLAIATNHANRTLQNHFRPDNSSFHVVSYEPDTGAVESKGTHQGAADDSAWARGQAWGLYGFTAMYRETRNLAYLEQARKIANFILNHPRLPADGIPYWDFDAPGIPNAKRDASAAAVMASAFIELSGMVDPELSARCLATARRQLLTLNSPAYRVKPGQNGNFLLQHSVGFFNKNSEVDQPLNYADYYFLEALLRYRNQVSK